MKQEELVFFSSDIKVRRGLAATERALRRMPVEIMSPCAVWVNGQMPFFVRQMRMLRMGKRFASRLPKGKKDAGLLEAAREIVFSETGVVNRERVVRVLRKWEKPTEEETLAEKNRWTLQEMGFLEYALRRALMEKAVELMEHCIREAGYYREARRFVAAFAGNKAVALPREAGGLEMLLRILPDEKKEQVQEGILAEIKKQYPDHDKTVQGVMENRVWVQERIRETVNSLKRLVRMDFMAVAEEVCPVFQQLCKHRGFMRMDRESRHAYARFACRVGKEYQIPEWEAARAAVVLSMGGEREMGDPGYYLMEHPAEIGIYCGAAREGRKRDAYALLRTLIAAETVPALFLGVLFCILGMPVFLLPFFAVVAGNLFCFLLTPFICRLFPVRSLPRLYKKWGPDQKKILVAIPVTLRGRRHFLKMARRMLVMYHACSGSNAEFLLLCDLPKGAHRHGAEDAEILDVMPSVVDALNDQTENRPFHVLLRDRQWQKKQELYAGTGGKAGAVSMLCTLIANGSTEESIRYSSLPENCFHRKYDYVITLEENTFLPAGMLEKWVGAMCHPLQQGRVGVIVPRMRIRGSRNTNRIPVCDLIRRMPGVGTYKGSGILDPYLVYSRLQDAPEDIAAHFVLLGAWAHSVFMEDGFVIREAAGKHPLAGHLEEQMEESVLLGGMAGILGMHEGPDFIRYRFFDTLRKNLLPLCSMVLVLFAACNIWPAVLLFALPWGERDVLLQTVLMPQRAFLCLRGFMRGMRFPGEEERPLRLDTVFLQPPGVMIAAVVLGTVVLLHSLGQGGFPLAAAWGALWVFSPFLKWILQLPSGKQGQLSARAEAKFRELARETWHFFEAFVTEETHFLPPDEVQLLPDTGLCGYTSPVAMAMYLLSCVSAREMKFLGGEEMGNRIHRMLCAMEKLPRLHGLFYHAYDTGSLQKKEDVVLSRDAGILAMALLCTAQALRVHLRQLPPNCRNLPERLDRLFDEMSFEKLYDNKEKLFHVSVREGKASPEHCDMLMHETLLLSFAALAKGSVPREQMKALNRACVHAGGGWAPLSEHGALNEYLTPFLLLPLRRCAWLGEGALNAVRAQMSFLPERPWGMGECACAEFDGKMRYRHGAFGLPFLAENGQSSWQAVSPAMSLLAAPFFPRAVYRNVVRMEKRGWKSMYGFLETVDFTPARLEKAPRMVWSHTAEHQGMVLCALCNALKHDALVSYVCSIPRVESVLPALEEIPRGRLIRDRRMRYAKKMQPEDQYSMLRVAQTGAMRDALAIGFNGNAMVVDQKGYGVTRTGDVQWNMFTGEAGSACGQRVLIRNAQTGEEMYPADGKTVFETGAVVYETQSGTMRVMEKRTLAPLTGAQITHITLFHSGYAPMDAEVESILAVSLQRAGKQTSGEFDVLRPDERVLVMRRRDEKEPWMLAQRAVGNFGILEMETVGHILSVRMRMTIPPRGHAVCALITLAGKNEKEMERAFSAYGDMRKVEESFSLSRAGAVWYAKECTVDKDRQALYGRLLGACWFYAQPHQMCLPPLAGEGAFRELIADGVPVLSVQCMENMDRPLIAHVLRFRRWLQLQGIRINVCILLPHSKGVPASGLDAVKRLLSDVGENAENTAESGLYIYTLHAGEETQILRMSRLVLWGGKPLEKQLDELANMEMPPIPYWDIPIRQAKETDGQEYGLNLENGHIRRKTGRIDGFEHMLFGKQMAVSAGDHGPEICFAAGMQPLTAPFAAWEQAGGEKLLIRAKEQVYDAWYGDAEYEPAAVTYTAWMDHVTVRTELFLDHTDMRTLRRVTLRAEEDAEVNVCWCVHLTLGQHAEYTRMMQRGGAVAAVNSALPYTAYAVTDMPDVQVVLHGLNAWFDCRLPLKSRESQTLILEVGCVRDVLQTPFTVAEHDYALLLRRQRMNWQKKLQKWQVYTMDPYLDRMINIWLPCLTEGELLKQDLDDCAGWTRCIFAALCCTLTEPDRAKSLLSSCAENAPDTESRLFCLYAWTRMKIIMGDMEPIYDAVLGKFQLGENGLPLNETGRESVRLAFMYIVILKEAALCCNQEEEAVLQKQAADMLRVARRAWNGACFDRYQGEDSDSLDVRTQCLAAWAGVPVRQARKSMEQAYAACMQSLEAMDGMTAVLLIRALVMLEEEEKAWYVFRSLIPDQDTLARGNWEAFCKRAPACFEALLFCLLGVDKRGENLVLRPAASGMPEKEVTVIYRYGEGVYHLTCTDACFVTTLDGKKQEDRHIVLSSEKGTHEARFPIWKVP